MYVYPSYNIYIKVCRPSVGYNPTIMRSVRNSILPLYILIEIECITTLVLIIAGIQCTYRESHDYRYYSFSLTTHSSHSCVGCRNDVDYKQH